MASLLARCTVGALALPLLACAAMADPLDISISPVGSLVPYDGTLPTLAWILFVCSGLSGLVSLAFDKHPFHLVVAGMWMVMGPLLFLGGYGSHALTVAAGGAAFLCILGSARNMRRMAIEGAARQAPPSPTPSSSSPSSR